MAGARSFTSYLVDDHEKHFRRIYPYSSLFRYQQQLLMTLGGILGLAVIVLVSALLPLALLRSDTSTQISFGFYTFLGPAVLFAVAAFWLVVDVVTRQFGKLAGVIGLLLSFVFLSVGLQNFLLGADYVGKVAEAVFSVSVPLTIAIVVFAIPAILFPLYLFWVSVRAAVSLFRVTSEGRSMMRETSAGSSLLPKFLIRVLGLPPSFESAKRPRTRFLGIVLIALLSAFFFALASLFALAWSVATLNSFKSVYEQCGRNGDCAYSMVLIVGSISLVGLPVVIFALAAVGAVLQRVLQRLLRFSLMDVQRIDQRAPFLFLRAFADDQVPLLREKFVLLTKLFEIGKRRTNLDEMLLLEGTPYGPVVALGKPGDAVPPYGAARGYFANRNWQEAVTDLTQRSAAIVICVDEGDGIWWEAEHLAATGHFSKTLFLIHPKHASTAGNAKLVARLADILRLPHEARVELTTVIRARRDGRPDATLLGLWVNNHGDIRAFRSSTFSRFAYLLTVRMFLHESLGLTGCSEPAPSR